MNDFPYTLLTVYGQVNTLAVVNTLFESINEKVLFLDEIAYGYTQVKPDNYVLMEWIGKPKTLSNSQPLLGFLKDRLRSYMYPSFFNINIFLIEKGE